MKKRLFWIVPVVVILLAAIAFPVFKWQELEANSKNLANLQEATLVENSFFQTYGQQVKINNFVKPEDIKIYGVSWSDDQYVHTSLNVNGVWVEIGRTEIPKTVTPTPTSNQ